MHEIFSIHFKPTNKSKHAKLITKHRVKNKVKATEQQHVITETALKHKCVLLITIHAVKIFVFSVLFLFYSFFPSMLLFNFRYNYSNTSCNSS